MRIQYRWVMLLFTILYLQACTLPLPHTTPRLGVETIRLYDNKVRKPIPADQQIPIYNFRDDVPFRYVVIGEIVAAPTGEPDSVSPGDDYIEYDPLELLRRRARELGGVALAEVKRGTEKDSIYVWKGVVLGKVGSRE